MKFQYIEDKSLLEFKDELRFHQRMLKFVFVLIFTSQILQLLSYRNKSVDGLFFIFCFLALIVLCFFCYIQFKKTSKNTIDISEIKSLDSKLHIKKKAYKLVLKNGKERDLDQLSTAEIAALKKLLHSLKISNV